MRPVVAALLLLVCTAPAYASPDTARHKPGPVTLRGVARAVNLHGFVLSTTHHGSYAVTIGGATTVTIKGKSGHSVVHNGDHVGVHGFVQGQAIRAISVRIYPVKPKQASLRGTVVSVHREILTVSSGGRIQSIRLNAQTQFTSAHGPSRTSDLKPGGRVLVRIEETNPVIALRVHIYIQRAVAKHVSLHGTITATGNRTISVAAGSTRVSIALSSQTLIHRGASIVDSRALTRGQVVTVHACCVGGQLVATSIHIDITAVVRHVILNRGHVTAISITDIRINTGRASTTVQLQPTTTYEVGSAHVTRSSVRIGDDVSVRAVQVGNRLLAERVHVYAVSRRPRTFDGRAVAIGRGTLTLDVHAKRYTLAVDPKAVISLAGRNISFGSIRPGDRVRAQGHPAATGEIILDRISIKRTPPKLISLRGTIVAEQGSIFIIADVAGTRHQVKLASGVRPTLHGSVAPATALFTGVQAHAHGQLAGNILIASSLSLTVRSGSAKGRVATHSGDSLVIQTTSGSTRTILLTRGFLAIDGTRRVPASSLRAGAYVQVQGYVVSPSTLRAVRLVIQHIQIDLAAVVVSNRGAITVRTTRGQSFRLRFSSSASIITSRAALPLAPTDIPIGARVHVQGTVDSSGSLVVTSLIVRLRSVTVRGQLVIASQQHWTMQSSATTYQLRLATGITISQGTHMLTSGDVVSGDDATVYGYSLTANTLLVHKISVHRKLVGVDGTVSSLTVNGFLLHASDGDHRIVAASSTPVTGIATTVSAGANVHVTGYLRGDGVILATRIRVKK